MRASAVREGRSARLLRADRTATQTNLRSFKGPLAFADPPLADAPLQNAAQVRGSVVVIRRGGGSFFDKATRAAAAGASGIVFVNNVDDVFFAECEGIPCDIPSVTVALSAYERLADLKLLDPISWFVKVDTAGAHALQPSTCIEDTLASGRKLRLYATVVSASGLRSADGDTDLYPFIEVMCQDQFKRTRTHRAGGMQPLWNQRLSFLLAAGSSHISLRCQDEGSLSAAELVGENENVSLDELFQVCVCSHVRVLHTRLTTHNKCETRYQQSVLLNAYLYACTCC